MEEFKAPVLVPLLAPVLGAALPPVRIVCGDATAVPSTGTVSASANTMMSPGMPKIPMNVGGGRALLGRGEADGGAPSI